LQTEKGEPLILFVVAKHNLRRNYTSDQCFYLCLEMELFMTTSDSMPQGASYLGATDEAYAWYRQLRSLATQAFTFD